MPGSPVRAVRFVGIDAENSKRKDLSLFSRYAHEDCPERTRPAVAWDRTDRRH